MTIKIPVEATYDDSAVAQGVSKTAQTVNQANKTKYKPIDKDTLRDLDDVNKKFQELLRVNRELSRRVKATGQSGALFEDIDFKAIFPDSKVRNRQMQAINAHVGAGSAPSSGGGGGGGARSAFGGVVTGAAQAGLRAMGPAGGVASGALGTGMSSGFGAGLMGLLGGMLALGVGKLVSGVMDKVGQAEENNIAYDRLKRTLGDVNVSFDGLKSVVKAGADNLKITYDEAGKLSQQFAKLGNLKGDQYGSLYDELGTGVGMSRAFGLDPSQGVGVMGQMRGIGVTRDAQDSKRFALLIGETIGRSGAFAKADEVMDALASYASSQARATLSGPNTAGYAGMLSSMVGSGITGLDPSNSAAILARVNATLAAGGGKGEASQFFTARLGARRGMDVFDTQLWREGGAFATANSTFQGDGAVAQFYRKYGLKAPSGNESLLGANISQIKSEYGKDPKAMLQAMSNQLGISMSQAAAFDLLKPNQMGEMEKYAGDLTKMSGSGIGNLSKALYGSASDRQALSQQYLSRTGNDALSDEDRKLLTGAKSDSELKDALASIAARYDQERTMGSDIRDSKAALDNIKTNLADKLVPIMQEMRHGIMYLAGGGKKSYEEMAMEVVNADSAGRRRSIEARTGTDRDKLLAEQEKIKADQRGMTWAAMNPAESDKDAIARKKRMNENAKRLEEIEKELEAVEGERYRLITEENARREKEIKRLEDAAAAKVDNQDDWVPGEAPTGYGSGGGYGGSGGRGTGGRSELKGDPGSTSAAMKYFMSRGWSKEQSAGIVSNLVAESGLRAGAVGDGGLAYGAAQWHPDRQRDFERWAGKSIKNSTLDEQLAFVHYELTEGKERAAGDKLRTETDAGRSGALISRKYERPADREGEAYRRAKYAEKLAGTPLPDAAESAGPGRGSSPGNDGSGTKTVEIILKDKDKKAVAPPIKVHVGRNGDFVGGGR